MKFFVFAFALLVAGTSAFPQSEDAQIVAKEERLVTGTVRDIIRQIQQTIRDLGLDPLYIESFNYQYNVPLLVNINIFIEELTFTGASNIQINNLDYSVLLNRFRFDLELPELALTVGNSGVDANVLGTRYNAVFKGSNSVQRIRLSGEVRVNVGIISGISIRSLEVKFSLGGISSDLTLVLFGEDLSSQLNEVLNNTIPSLLKQYENEINQLLTDVIRAAADAILS